MNRRTLVLMSGGALAVPAWAEPPGSAPAEGIVVRDDRGAVRRFAVPPRRLVTMMPSLTEAVAVLGGVDRLVGVDSYSDGPPPIAALPRLGGLDDARLETIVALRPDAVLASISARSLDRLEALGLTVLRFRSDTHADVRRMLEAVAVLLGTPARGPLAWARVERELEAAARRVPASMRGWRVYFEVGDGPYAAGAASFIGETLARLGLVDIVPRELGAFPRLNPEFVVRAQPDLVMGSRREAATLAGRPGWAALRAFQTRRQCGFDREAYDLLTRPGPRIGEAAGRVVDCLVRLADEGAGAAR